MATFAIAGEAQASHYRYGTLSWEPTENENEVLFTGDSAWRWSYPSFGEPQIGEILDISSVDSSVDPIQTGDGGTVPFQVEIVAINEDRDWFYGVLVDDDGTKGIPYTYEAFNDDGAAWEAEWSGCCRISERHAGNYHVNNPGQSMRMETRVDLATTEEGSPHTSLPPISQCRINATCTIQVPAVHPAGDEITFRESTTTEAGDHQYVPPGLPDAPNQATIDETSGTIEWNTTGAEHDPDFDAWDTLYSMQVMLEDGQTKVALDFLIELVPNDTEFPYWTDDTTVCGTTQPVDAGDTITFDVTAASDDEARIIELDNLGLPPGASFPSPTPANPVTGTFTWEPSLEQGGTHLVIFTAVDDEGAQAPPCPVTIEVEDHAPEFTAPSPCITGEPITGVKGHPLSFPVKAQSPLSHVDIVSFTVTGGPGVASLDEGPGNPAEGTWTWDSPTIGPSVVTIQAEDNRGVTSTCTQTIAVQAPAGQSLVTGLWTGTSVPASLEYETTVTDQRGHGETTHEHASVDPEADDAYVEGLAENASVDLAAGTAAVTGSASIAYAELFGGLVTVEGLSHTAHIEWDILQAEVITEEVDFHVERVTVAGEEVPVRWEGEPVTVPLPHGGMLTLFNHTLTAPQDRADYAGQLLHAYAPMDYSRSEIILGSVVLGAGGTPSLDGGPFAYKDQPRMIHDEDDARRTGDAGDGPTEAEPIEPGVYDGALPPGDTRDYYAIDLTHGDKINLALQPAPRATATGGQVHADENPPPDAEGPTLYSSPFEFWGMRLLDPDLEEREISNVFVSGSTERIEFNADTNGTWFVEITRLTGDPPEAYNYTLSATVTPVPFLPENEATPWTDTPPACDPSDEDIPRIESGLRPGQFQHDDHADTYRFDADIGEIISVALKPGETADGVNMALVLYDEDCQELQRSSWNDEPNPVIPKGLPELTPELPSRYTGDYFIGVERVNGVGNYYLSLTVANPMPTLPGNDALTEQDAQTACDDATPAPPALYQGRLHDGDPGDAYKIPFQEDHDAFLAIEMSATASINVQLTTPAGTEIPPDTVLMGGTWMYDFTAPETGDYCLEIVPEHAGGNYMVSHGETPPLPAFLPVPPAASPSPTAGPLGPLHQAS